jgi:hypothetical protein
VTGPTAWLRRIVPMPFPWPARSRRHEAIEAARREKERSQAGAVHAATIRRQIEAIAETNHFAEVIARDIIHRHSRGGRGEQ